MCRTLGKTSTQLGASRPKGVAIARASYVSPYVLCLRAQKHYQYGAMWCCIGSDYIFFNVLMGNGEFIRMLNPRALAVQLLSVVFLRLDDVTKRAHRWGIYI